METTFRAGKRLTAMKVLALVVNCAVVFVFYFIYRYLLGDAVPALSGAPLAVLFLGLGALVAAATLWVARKYADTVCYQVGQDALVVGCGAQARRYPWPDFTAAALDQNGAYRLGTVLPLSFQVGGETLTLNQYVGNIYGLADAIFQRIEPYAEIPEELKRQVCAMKGAF